MAELPPQPPLLQAGVSCQHLLETAGGYRRDRLGADLRRQPLAWGIMHRYSNPTWRVRLPERRPAVAIYGPTSSGKTALSL